MNIDFNQKLLSFEGKVLWEMTANDDGARGPNRDLTLRAISTAALNFVFQDEKAVGAAEKDDRFALQLKLYAKDVVDLEADEITKIKNLIGKMQYTPCVIGQARLMLDGKDTGLVLKVDGDDEGTKKDVVEDVVDPENSLEGDHDSN